MEAETPLFHGSRVSMAPSGDVGMCFSTDPMPRGVRQHGEGSPGCPSTTGTPNRGTQPAVPGQRVLPRCPQMGTDATTPQAEVASRDV